MSRIYTLITCISILFGSGFANSLFAQCSPGQVQLSLIVNTDNFGSETYWQIVPAGNNCGVGTVGFGGNNSVGCNGGGAQNGPGGGYGNNQTYTEGPFCITESSNYDLINIDDWGDSGPTYDLYINGFKSGSFSASGPVSTYTFKAEEPLDYDAEATELSTAEFITKGDKTISGTVKNVGKLLWTSIELSYSIDNGTPVSQTFTGISVGNDNTLNFTFNTPWSATDAGNHVVKYWVGSINGNSDQNPNNDEITKVITVSSPIPNIIDQFTSSGYTIKEIVNSTDQVAVPRDLDFHPNFGMKQLWIINKGTENSGGSTVIVDNAGDDVNQVSQYVQDGNAWHFMSLPTAIAFSDNGNFGTTPGVQDANHSGGTFTGPSLWSSDLSIYGVVGNPPTASFNGSHLDMLHGSPYSMGMAHEKDNVFWVYDSYNKEIVRYDFVKDHGPGQDDHSDAILRRYTEVVVERNGTHIPNHMVLDKETGWLYIVDNLNQRIMRMDINSGSMNQNLPLINEPLAQHEEWTGATLEIYISGLTSPSGIDIIDDRLLVGDFQTGDIIIYDVSGPAVELGRVSTGAAELMGIKIGPEGHIWYVDASSNTVNKAESNGPPVGIDYTEHKPVKLYPNPTVDQLIIERLNETPVENVIITDASGRTVKQVDNFPDSKFIVDVSSLQRGTYFLSYRSASNRYVYKFNKL